MIRVRETYFLSLLLILVGKLAFEVRKRILVDHKTIVKPEKFSAHSFRHGSVSLAIAEEPNLALVRLATDHNSDAIWAYAQVEAAKRRSVSAAMLEAVHHAAQQLR